MEEQTSTTNGDARSNCCLNCLKPSSTDEFSLSAKQGKLPPYFSKYFIKQTIFNGILFFHMYYTG